MRIVPPTSYQPKKIAFVDLETSGLSPNRHEILEIGVIVYDVEKNTLREFEAKIKPTNIEAADPKALELNGYNEKEWKHAISLRDALAQLAEACEGASFLAYNVTFDWSFMEEAYRKTNMADPFHYHRICVMSMAWFKIPKAKVNGYSLKTVCAYLGIEPEPKMHRALNGARKAMEVYMKLTKV